MPCLVQIKKNIIEEVESMAGNYTHKSPPYIRTLENTINHKFKEKIVQFAKQTDDSYLSNIKVSDKLIDAYYQNELVIEESQESYESGTSTLAEQHPEVAETMKQILKNCR